ncbi:MAG: lamin tail domain-containing protein [Labilithrix sp.]|nr:lamin tail domain-containing protein [Labilithrix sp.]MCW5816482.1 lamin tail domain-containing protein [Labilithrix sp.]
MRLRGFAAAAFAPSIVLVWSCATEPPPEVVAAIDPSIPTIDASWSPSPAAPSPVDAAAPPSPPPREEPHDERDERDEPDAAPASAPPLRAAAGELFLTEVMYDPLGPEPASEWFEVYNAADTPRSLAGLTLHDGADRTHTIAGEPVVAPGAYAVLARDRDAAIADGVPADAIVYVYGAEAKDGQGILLANGATGAIAIADGATEIARVEYGALGFAAASGRSAQATGDDAGTWCSADPTPGYAANTTSCL